MADGTFAGKIPALVFFQAFDNHKVERRVYASAKAVSVFVKSRVIGRKRCERMVCSECLWVRKVRNEHIRFVFVRNFSHERPEPGDCFLRKLFFKLVKVVVKARVGVPHLRVDSRLKREVHAFVLETQFLVVQDVAERGHVKRVYCECAVKVHRIESSRPW